MIKNLSQLKMALKKGARFEIISHCRSECVGELREVNMADTQGIYTIVLGEPDNKSTVANGGRGTWLSWEKAPAWTFHDNVCSLYQRDSEHTEQNLILAFRVLEQEAA